MVSLLFFISILSVLGGITTLGILSWIDLKIRLLPNTYVFAFATFGVAFHASTDFEFISVWESALGILVGGGLLYGIRFVANRLYNQDTLGLGDVKLMMAAGLWLGAYDVLIALVAGACAGIVHGLAIYKTQKNVSLGMLSLPAGPGFIVGILIVGALKFLS